MKKSLSLITGLISLMAISNTALAVFNGDIAINEKDITFSTDKFTEGGKVRIYATATNNSAQDLLGIVRFYDSNGQISGDQVISIFAKKTDGVFIDWYPPYGEQTVKVKIFPWNAKIDDPSDNLIFTKIYVAQDTDHDGIPNDKDEDDDNDNVPDNQDAFPLNSKEQYDTDGDGTGDNADLDIDNDGVPNKSDEMPKDVNETMDTDKDGIGNNTDTDDDNDGITDMEELKLGTDPLKADTDGDGVIDGKDAFPLNPNESKDTDKDGIGDNIDTDIDNDGTPNSTDPFPTNKPPVIELTINNSRVELTGTNSQTSIATNPNNGKADSTSPTSNSPDSNKKTTDAVNRKIVDLFSLLTFDATPSFDDDGKIMSYKWEVDGKEVQEGNALNYSFEELGNHRVKVTIKDDSGQTVSQELGISVLNITFYKEIGITMLGILLALAIYFKYIRPRRASANNLINPI